MLYLIPVSVILLALVARWLYNLRLRKLIITEAEAVILNVSLTGVSAPPKVQADIQLQVQPERGKSFVADTRQMVREDDYLTLRPGKKITVNYRGTKKKQVLILRKQAELTEDTFHGN